MPVRIQRRNIEIKGGRQKNCTIKMRRLATEHKFSDNNFYFTDDQVIPNYNLIINYFNRLY